MKLNLLGTGRHRGLTGFAIGVVATMTIAGGGVALAAIPSSRRRSSPAAWRSRAEPYGSSMPRPARSARARRRRSPGRRVGEVESVSGTEVVSATCPGGHNVTGGGVIAPAAFDVQQSGPTDAALVINPGPPLTISGDIDDIPDDRWTVRVTNPGVAANVTVTAICVDATSIS